MMLIHADIIIIASKDLTQMGLYICYIFVRPIYLFNISVLSVTVPFPYGDESWEDWRKAWSADQVREINWQREQLENMEGNRRRYDKHNDGNTFNQYQIDEMRDAEGAGGDRRHLIKPLKRHKSSRSCSKNFNIIVSTFFNGYFG